MTSKSPRRNADRFDSEVDKWRVAIESGDFASALAHAATALQIAVQREEKALQKVAVVYVQTAMERIDSAEFPAKKRSRFVCSFCGRSQDDVRLVVGSEAQICEDC